jgi:hypothetical protein
LREAFTQVDDALFSLRALVANDDVQSGHGAGNRTILKGTYRINHPNVVFNYNAATPIVGATGNVSSGVLTLN